MLSPDKGFTLIELLVVISIIALLSTIVMTSVNGQRNRAKDVSFQSTAKSIQKAAGVCCTGNAAALLNTAGGNICNSGMNDKYPAPDNLGSVEVVRNCSSVDGFLLRLRPGSSNAGGLNYADCDRDDCQFVYN